MENDQIPPDLNHRTALRRPWNRCTRPKIPDQVLLMMKRNYKTCCDIAPNRLLMRKILSVVDTEAGPNFIRKDELPPEAEIDTGSKLPGISDANDNPIHMLGTTQQVFRLGHRVVSLTFIVFKTLAAPLILGCDFCDRFVEAIFPRQKTILMDDGTTVPITRRPLSRSPKLAPLPPGQVCEKDHERTSPKIRVSEKTESPPESQTWVAVTSQRHAVMVVQPNDATYANHSIAPTNGVVRTTPASPLTSSWRTSVNTGNRWPKIRSSGPFCRNPLPCTHQT